MCLSSLPMYVTEDRGYMLILVSLGCSQRYSIHRADSYLHCEICLLKSLISYWNLLVKIILKIPLRKLQNLKLCAKSDYGHKENMLLKRHATAVLWPSIHTSSEYGLYGLKIILNKTVVLSIKEKSSFSEATLTAGVGLDSVNTSNTKY